MLEDARNLLLENLVLPVGDWMVGGSFMSELRRLRRMDGDPGLQRRKLRSLLDHATSRSPYYSRLGVERSEDPVEHLRRFPILTKALLRRHTPEMLTMPVEGLTRECSSGTSGFQSIVHWTRHEQSQNRATQLLWWEWAGYRIGDPLVQTGITPNRGAIKGIKDKLLNTYYLHAFSHSQKDAADALEWAGRKRNPVLAGYASSLYVLAQFAEKMGMKVRFKTAISWGDKLFPHYRRLIESVFSTRVHETYGSAEGLMMGAQRDLDYMYLMNSNVFIEILDDEGNPVPDGGMGHVIVTNLNAYAMPLIRYRIGDLARLLTRERYPPERMMGFPLIEKVVGRDTDLVRTPGGKMMVVHSFTGVFEHIPEISQFKVIQERLEGIAIEFVRGEGFHEGILKRVEQNILDNLREPFDIQFREVDAISPSPSGKPQLIVSLLGKKS